MAEDYDYDGDTFLDMDDGWIYVEDEFDIADELAEGQIADPGYSGTNHEIDMEGYEFDLFGYWEDLDYGDDAYWDYGLPGKDPKTGEKRKRGIGAESTSTKESRAGKKQAYDREAEPLLFRSRKERNRVLNLDAPRNKEKPYSFLPDWKERFANADGIISSHNMPEAMKKAAEAQDDGREGDIIDGEDEGEGEEGDWEDESEDEGGFALDPEMLKTILRDRLGGAGLEGMDEEAFMQAIQKMMSGEGEGDAADDLTNALLGKVTAEGGDEAVSGWLSQQGVSLEDDDDASSVATADLPKSSQRQGRGQHQSPPDSAVSITESGVLDRNTLLHATTPTTSSKKRAADNEQPGREEKKVKFDTPSGSQSSTVVGGQQATEDGGEDASATVDTESAAKAKADSSAPKSRKRKTTTEESDQKKPAAKKARSREVQQLGPLPEAPSPAPPAKRTRSAKAKGGR